MILFSFAPLLIYLSVALLLTPCEAVLQIDCMKDKLDMFACRNFIYEYLSDYTGASSGIVSIPQGYMNSLPPEDTDDFYYADPYSPDVEYNQTKTLKVKISLILKSLDAIDDIGSTMVLL